MSEGDRFVQVTLQRTSPPDQSAGVRLIVSGVTATPGRDYLGSTRSLSFRAGETLKSIRIRIRQDSLVEGDETVALSLLAPRRDALALRTTALLVIRDDDASPPPQ